MKAKKKFSDKDFLNRERMKTILGGYVVDDGDCMHDCKNDSACPGSQVCVALKPKACEPYDVNRCVYPPFN